MRATRSQLRFLGWTLAAGLAAALAAPAHASQPDPDASPAPPARQAGPGGDDLTAAQSRLDIQPVAADDQIRERLQSVIDATGWFTEPFVRVEDGVVFLSGRADTEELKRWAGDLARNTEGVAAVANRMDIAVPSPWDFGAATSGVSRLWRDFVASTPFIVLGLIILALSALSGLLVTRALRVFLAKRIRARLLKGLLARAAGVIVFLVGAYVVLRVAGLTQLALTIVGGTGLIGLAVGIAFRDITENYLASIFLSIQRPFETGDLVEIVGVTGFVQQLNVRTTVLMSLDGNLVQIPNSAVYKNIIINFTANPNRQGTFTVGIGYDDSIEQAQEIARAVLANHPAVLKDPEPWVLVDSLGASTVNLRIYFWFDGHTHNILKLRSALIRLVKHAFQKNGISMPDEAREIIFPAGVPVAITDQREGPTSPPQPEPAPVRPRPAEDTDPSATPAEAGLTSDAGVIEEQARQVKPLDHTENLLKPKRDGPPET
ncbi:MAG: mechanosensitive ion channel [Phycisphaerales bacterium]|nr:mechanosensitive ion channel [Phycisphaerales bacterium]